MIQTVRRRQFDTRAVRWLGEPSDAAAIAELGAQFEVLTEPCDDDPDATGSLLAGPHNVWELVYDGDWIVAVDGGFVRMSADEFTADFESVSG